MNNQIFAGTLALILFPLIAFTQCPTSGVISSNCTSPGDLVIDGGNLTINSGVVVTVSQNLILRNNATLTALGGTINVNNDFVEEFGSLNSVSGGSINLVGNFTTGGGSSFTIEDANVTMSGGVISLNNETQTVRNTVFSGGSTFSVNLNSLVIDASNISVTSNLTIQNGLVSNSNFSIGGLLQINSGNTTIDNTIIDAGTSNSGAPGTTALNFNGGGSLIANNNSEININGDVVNNELIIDDSDVVVTGNFNNAGDEILIVQNNGSIRIGGNFDNSGSGNVEANDGGSIEVQGDFDNTGGGSVDTDGGTVIVGGDFSGNQPTGDGSGCSNGNGACCGSSSFCSVLPVTLISFRAVSQIDQVNLQWVTASEVVNDHFTLFRSLDGSKFIEIARVKGNGTTSNITRYSYDDNRVSTSSSLFYKLSQTDYDGTTEVLSTIFVEGLQTPLNSEFYPTVISRDLKLRRKLYNTEPTVSSAITIHDLKGGSVATLSSTIEGNEEIVDLSGQRLNNGIYLIKAIKGTEVITQKFVVR